jgi:hypothetical protein
MQEKHNIRMTSAEVASLWIQYLSDSSAVCVMKYFIKKTEDTEILPVLQYALQLAESHLLTIDEIFKREEFPTPVGFTNKDVIPDAPRLFSDPMHLNVVKNQAKSGMIAYGLSQSLASRADIRQFFRKCLAEASDLDEQATQVMLSKGTYVRQPYITVPDRVEYVASDKFLGSLFGKQRPLSALEITHLFLNAQSNGIGKAILVGFSQVARSTELRQFFVEGATIADKHVEIFGQSLKESGVPAPMSLDSDITDSTTPPFSDKLMLFQICEMMAMGLGYYAAAMGASFRMDLAADYGRLMVEIETYVHDGVKILIKNGWMEEPPLADDRKQLALSGENK